MGWAPRAAWPVPVDDRFRLRPEALPAARRAAEARRAQGDRGGGQRRLHRHRRLRSAGGDGRLLRARTASGSTWTAPTGPPPRSAPAHRRLVQGIERADSVVWDAHKLMLMPALVTAVLFRDGRRSYEAFAQEAPTSSPTRDREQQWCNLACARSSAPRR